jgi:hypothetical protein
MRYPLEGSNDPDPDPYQNVTDPEHWYKGQLGYLSTYVPVPVPCTGI